MDNHSGLSPLPIQFNIHCIYQNASFYHTSTNIAINFKAVENHCCIVSLYFQFLSRDQKKNIPSFLNISLMSCHFISYGMLLMMILFDIKLIRLVLSRCLSSLRGDLDLDPLLEDRLTGDLDLDLDNDLKESFFFKS